MNQVTFFDIKKSIETNESLSKCIIELLIKNDYLLAHMNSILPLYKEHIICFEPTYKRNPHNGIMTLEKHKGFTIVGRLPGYADRVLIKTRHALENELYDSIPLKGNDHFPIVYICTLKSITIGIFSWNVGSGNPSSVCPDLLQSLFIKYKNHIDVFVIGFQEACIYTKPDPSLWKDYYDSHIEFHGSNFKSFLGHIAGFGLEMCVLWNSENVCLYKIAYEKNTGTCTKGLHSTKMIVIKSDAHVVYTLGNVHAPFTESTNKYWQFFKKVNDTLDDMGKSDIIFLFGDLNSRSIFPLHKREAPRYIKNISLKKSIPPPKYSY